MTIKYLHSVLNIYFKGVDIYSAVNGMEAINIYRDNSDIDIILLDVNMPDFNGYELSRIIKDENSNIKVIMQTASDISKDEFYKSGCDSFLRKPMKPKDIVSAIKKVL